MFPTWAQPYLFETKCLQMFHLCLISVVDFHEWNPTETQLGKTYKQPIKNSTFQLKSIHSEMFEKHFVKSCSVGSESSHGMCPTYFYSSSVSSLPLALTSVTEVRNIWHGFDNILTSAAPWLFEIAHKHTLTHCPVFCLNCWADAFTPHIFILGCTNCHT